MFWHNCLRLNRKVVFVEVRYTLSTSYYYVLLFVEKHWLLWNEDLFVSDSYGVHLFRKILFNWIISSYPFYWDIFEKITSWERATVFFLKKKAGMNSMHINKIPLFQTRFNCISFQSWYILSRVFVLATVFWNYKQRLLWNKCLCCLR